MPTLAEVEADPKFKGMSPEAQMLVRRKLSPVETPSGGGDASGMSGMVQNAAGAIGNAATGFAKAAGETATTLMKPRTVLGQEVRSPIADLFGPGMTEVMKANAPYAGPALQREGTAQNVGGLMERLAEMVGAGAGGAGLVTNPMAVMAKAGLSGAGMGAQNYAETGDPQSALGAGLTGAVTGGLASKLSAFKAGAKAVGGLGELGKDAAAAAEERIPLLQKQLKIAAEKGVGRGAGGKFASADALGQELEEAQRVAARGQTAQQAGMGTAPETAPNTTAELVKKALPYIIGFGANGALRLAKKLGSVAMMD